MSDYLSEEDVVAMHQAMVHRKASRLATAVFSIDSVMAYIKVLLLEHSHDKHPMVGDMKRKILY